MKLRKSHYGLIFGGMMQFTMKWITVWNIHTPQLMFVFSYLGRPRVLSFSKRLVKSITTQFTGMRGKGILKYLISPLSFGMGQLNVLLWWNVDGYGHVILKHSRHNKSPLIQVMTWGWNATIHYLKSCKRNCRRHMASSKIVTVTQIVCVHFPMIVT